MTKIIISFTVSNKLKKGSQTVKMQDYIFEYVMAWLKGEKVKDLKLTRE